MRKVIAVVFLVVLFFMAEFVLFNTAGRWFTPNLLLLLIIFLNLCLGIRYSILSAFLAGLIKDSFSGGLFGIYLFAFIMCAYGTTMIQGFFYHKDSVFGRLLLVFVITAMNIFIHYGIRMMFGPVRFLDVVGSIFVPQMLATLVISPFIFSQLRKCASRLFV